MKTLRAPVLGFALLAATSLDVAAQVECKQVFDLPAATRSVSVERFRVPRESKLSQQRKIAVPQANAAFVQVRQNGRGASLFGLISKSESGVQRCTRSGTVNDGGAKIYDIEVVAPVDVLIQATPGADLEVTVFTSGAPAGSPHRPADPPHVGVPLHVYVMPEAPLAPTANSHVKSAVEIWEQAGIHLQPKTKRLTLLEAEPLIGKDLTVQHYLGCPQRFDSGFEEREALARYKPSVNALAIFFVKTTAFAWAEIEFTQAYMANDLASANVGRTLAHEIGHLLLGDGHTGGEQQIGRCDRFKASMTVQPKRAAPWTSGLMKGGEASASVDISAVDAVTARRTALGLPGAVWWPR